MIKAIVLDVDGTLLTKDKTISTETKETLQKIQTMGITLILASGRPTSGLMTLANTLKMSNGYLVSFNGACVFDIKNQAVIHQQAFPKQDYCDLMTHLKAYPVIPMVNQNQHLVVPDVFMGMIHLGDHKPFNIIEYEARSNGASLLECPDMTQLKESVYKVLVAANPEVLDSLHEELTRPFNTRLAHAFSAPFYLEFTAFGIDKATTLKKVFQPLGFDASSLVAFGDGLNDLSMLQYAGTGIAMANADEKVKQAADRITLSNDQDGIAKSLKALFPTL